MHHVAVPAAAPKPPARARARVAGGAVLRRGPGRRTPRAAGPAVRRHRGERPSDASSPPDPDPPRGRLMYAVLKRLLLGRPLRSAEQEHQRLIKVVALAIFSSDAISSTAYAPRRSSTCLSLKGRLPARPGTVV